MSVPSVILNNGTKMPMLGLGTWDLRGSECVQAVKWALDARYRHIDTASIYGNEREVGLALKKSDVPRKEIFITTKIWDNEQKNPEGALEASLKRLGLDYVDLYLIHWPAPERNETWKMLSGLAKERKCRAIGVSNFTIRHLKELLSKSKNIPAVNQVEFSPFLYQQELLEFCKSKGIQLEAYSPLTRGEKLKHPELLALARKYGKTPAQVVLRWDFQHGIVAIPKSKTKERILENASIFDFEISAPDMHTLDALNENFRACPDPEEYP